MALDVDQIFTDMLAAGAASFGASWKKAETFATHEFEIIALRLVQIAKAAAALEFDQETARLLVAMQINNSASLIASMTTLILKAVQDAINAAIAVVRQAINNAAGFVLLA